MEKPDTPPNNNSHDQSKSKCKPDKLTAVRRAEYQRPNPIDKEPVNTVLPTVITILTMTTSIVLTIIAFIALIHTYINYLPSKPIVFTPEKLSNYQGQYRGRILLAILGEVFDVTPGRRHYGIGGSYHGFAGHDASKAFITGEFVKDLHDDVEQFTPEECSELVRWRDFYRNHEEYKYKGIVIGRFYDTNGESTPLLHDIEQRSQHHRDLKEAEKLADEMNGERLCSVTWSRTEGGWVSCKEGHYPRKIRLPKQRHNDDPGNVVLQERCACFESDIVSDVRQVYGGCEVSAHRCQTSLPDEEL